MTGSVSNEARDAQPDKLKTTGKCDDKPTPEKSTQPLPASPPLPSSPQDEASKSLLPPLVVEPSEKTPGSPKACRRKLHPSSKSASSLPSRPRMEELTTSSLARRGRAQSHLTLYGAGATTGDPVFGVPAGCERGLEDSCGARSELGAPVSARRRRRGDVRAYGTLERATSYSSLTATLPRPTFRSANSTRPPPAPPCTTTLMDFCRHPVHPSASSPSRLARAGTPRRNNPHPVGLNFQSPYNRDGKTFEVWNPNEGMVANQLPQMCQHIGKTNFTSGKMTYPSNEGMSPDRVSAGARRSVYQMSYRSPQGMADFDRRMPTTRFGSTHSRAAAVGVVPNVMSPRCGERRVKLHIPRGQKLESLV